MMPRQYAVSLGQITAMLWLASCSSYNVWAAEAELSPALEHACMRSLICL